MSRISSRGRLFPKGGGGADVKRPTDSSTPRPTSPPRGPVTRGQAKALRDKVNSLLSMCDFDAPLDGMLLHSDMLCVLRYHPHDGAEDALDGAQEVTKKNREDEQEKDQGAAEKTGVSGLPDTGVSGLRLGHHRCQAAFATGMGSGVWPECGRKLRPIDLTGVCGLPD